MKKAHTHTHKITCPQIIKFSYVYDTIHIHMWVFVYLSHVSIGEYKKNDENDFFVLSNK